MNPEGRETYLPDETDAGRLLYAERLWPSPRAWAVLIAIPLLVFVVTLPLDGGGGSLAYAAGALLFLATLRTVAQRPGSLTVPGAGCPCGGRPGP
ncbi:MAG: hypothetical protein JWN54_1322, partial [Mycobacterium sp.]|nr:hypothetical protein [Mycobacterium sp.]